jgi:hypothetical protein
MSPASRFQNLTKAVAVICALLLAPGDGLFLIAQDAPPPYQAPAAQPPLSPEQLDSLVAPIALYPDELLSQILVASTYPLELVEAGQFLQRNPGLNGPALTQAAQQQNWDPSVQALVIFPDLVMRLTQDVTWTTNLGNAFLAQQADVMDAVQRLRARAQQAGKLASTPQQRVIESTEAGQPVIDIEPVDPGVIYIPQYDPALIWGPPVYFAYPRWWYPSPGVALIGGAFFGFGAGIAIGGFFGGGWGGWGGWGWRPGWRDHTVIVNNNFIHRQNFNSTHFANIHGTTVWDHDAFHRQGVPYSNRDLTNRYRAPERANLAPRDVPGRAGFESHGAPNSPAPAGGFRGSTPPARPATPPVRSFSPPARSFSPPASSAPAQPNRGNFGTRQIPPSAPSRGAFGGFESGAAARVHSDHGFSSLGPARSGGGNFGRAPAAPRGGGGGRRR